VSNGTDPASTAAARLEAEAGARQARALQERAAAERRAERLGSGRLLAFVLLLVGGLAVPGPVLGPLLTAGALALFGWLVVLSGRADAGGRAADLRATYHADVVLRLHGAVPDGAFDGTDLVPAHHRDTAAALHVVGPQGLLARLGRPRTAAGARGLVALALEPVDAATRAARQEAVRELAGHADLLEDWAVEAADRPAATDRERITPWIEAPPARLDGVYGLVTDLAALLDSGLMIAFFVGAPTGLLGALGGIALHNLVWRWRGRHVVRALAAAEGPARDLALAGRLTQLLAARQASGLAAAAPFPTAALLRTQDPEAPATWARHLAALGRTADWVESLRNPFFLPFAWITGSGTRLARRFEAWRADHGAGALAWLDHLGRCDALIAVAIHAREHPTDAWPGPPRGNDPAGLVARAVRHPLLPRQQAVANDIALGGEAPRAYVVSGANMAGKSTWLRTLGANEVLARLGAPVAAASWHGGPFALGTSLGVGDDLLHGVSRFQAEVLRMAEIVAGAQAQRPYLFLLDELLGGTTSEDRRLGARALLRRLLASGAVGLLTTHDLALARLADDDARVANVHFGAEVVGGRLVFDHRVQPGVIRGSSARALLEAAGLIDPDEA
jgi:hypothetical protein